MRGGNIALKEIVQMEAENMQKNKSKRHEGVGELK